MPSEDTTEIILPDLFSVCPLASSFNPHYEHIRSESVAWVSSFNFFVGQKRTHYIRSDLEGLAAYTYPRANREDFRATCDLMNVLYVFDMTTDEQDGPGARVTAEVFLKAIAGEECPESECPLYQYVSQFVTRLNEKKLPAFRQRLAEHCKSYAYAIVHEADLRARNDILSPEDYRDLRRETSAVRACFDMFEFALGEDLPDNVFDDKAFRIAYWAGVDMVAWSNDLYSYNIEQSIGHRNANILSVFIKAYDISLQEAADRVGVVFESLMKDYIKYKSLVRSFGPDVDRHIEAYMRNVGDWVVGSLEWSFKSRRYFGNKNDEVRRCGVVKMLKESVWAENWCTEI